MASPSTLHLFCRVVDNFGDIGACWRLARQLWNEHGIAVTLWVDDLRSFRKICSAIDEQRPVQQVDAVQIRHWPQAFGPVAAADVADVVIEAFACELPAAYVEAMAARKRPPVWINLEYLSAESWVEDCHRMPSRHPVLPLTKYFFFPGFTTATGGLPLEQSLPARRARFQDGPEERRAFLAQLDVALPQDAAVVSLFCYPSAPAHALFDALRERRKKTVCLVPQGVATEAVTAFLGTAAQPGAVATRGALTMRVLPFVDQPDYDRLLWSCDLNFVRGEDSFLRAQWAARPFVWHIYPQDQDAHLVKLEAFLKRYGDGLTPVAAAAVDALWKCWNQGSECGRHWQAFDDVLPELKTHAANWERVLAAQRDLASSLVQFVREIS
jgi:uncharacterized repeat protein (TIGR03837 family)